MIPVLSTVNDYVSNEIQKTMDFFRNTSHGESIDRIVISGGGSNVLHLQESLTERFSIPVERLNPFHRVSVPARVLPPEEMEQMAASVGIAVGLAFRKVGDG